MLVLTRKHQEKIRIGDNITITILKTKGKAVRVGIEAPADIAVVRGELVANGASVGSPISAGAAEETAIRPRSERTRTELPNATWSTDSRPMPSAPSRIRQPGVEITLQRVSRRSAAAVLPHLATEGGPLRAMVERRAGV